MNNLRTTDARAAILALALCFLAGCARWQPQTSGPVEFSHACPLKAAPAVSDFGDAGVKAVYHFVIQDAPRDDLGALLDRSKAKGFSVILLPIEINGRSTLFVQGAKTLTNQAAVDAEFWAACGLGQGEVYLTHVRYDRPGKAGEAIRVR